MVARSSPIKERLRAYSASKKNECNFGTKISEDQMTETPDKTETNKNKDHLVTRSPWALCRAVVT